MNLRHSVIVDNFYEQPHALRDLALGLEFIPSPGGIYSGKRTRDLHDTHKFLYDLVKKRVLKYYDLNPNDFEAEINFHITESKFGQEGWVHSDSPIVLASVLYLNPNINDISSGTSFFDLKPNFNVDNHITGKYMRESFKEGKDNLEMKNNSNSKFIKTATVGGKFNRLVVYPGATFHAGEGFFGTGVGDSRLTLLSFFYKKDQKF